MTTSLHGFGPSASMLTPLRIKRSNCSSKLLADCLAPSITWLSAPSKLPLLVLLRPSARHTFKPLWTGCRGSTPFPLKTNHSSRMDTNTLAALRATHELYCQLTGQKLSLRFDRERLWYEFLRAGFSDDDLKTVVAYLQKEIRASRRNVGALKLSNLLQLDRFEEDLNISKVKLRYPPPSSSSHCTPSDPPAPTPAQRRKLRQQAKEALARLRQQLGDNLNP